MTDNEFIIFTEKHMEGLEQKMLYEDYAEAKSLFVTATELFKIDKKSPADLCIANLFMVMMQIKNPSILLDGFVQYILDYAETLGHEERTVVIHNLALRMASIRGNYMVSCLEKKLNWEKYYLCWKLINDKGLELSEKIPA